LAEKPFGRQTLRQQALNKKRLLNLFNGRLNDWVIPVSNKSLVGQNSYLAENNLAKYNFMAKFGQKKIWLSKADKNLANKNLVDNNFAENNFANNHLANKNLANKNLAKNLANKNFPDNNLGDNNMVKNLAKH
jgi:hypothetical protein